MNESGHLVVMNVIGVVVYDGSYVAGTEIGVNYPSGIYIVRINGSVCKLVKK